jgi:hypothetical protein
MKKETWEQVRDREVKAAIAKGRLPAKPWKGRLSKKHVGRAVLVGWEDTEPVVGLIVELYNATEVRVYFPGDEFTSIVGKDQIFTIGEGRVQVARVLSTDNDFSVSWDFTN